MSIDLKSLTVKNSLNSDIWTKDKKLNPKIRKQLIKIAKDFYKDLDIPWAELEDIKFTGSLANYNWSKYSDIDLHLVIDYSLVDENVDLVETYFSARKNLWNNLHEIKIYDYDVEVYVEDASEVHHSSGVYSITNNEWVVEPQKSKPFINKEAITKKSKVIMRLIDDFVVARLEDGKFEKTIESAELLSKKLKKMRSCGLESGGEYSVENLTYKILRRNGTLQKLYDAKITSYDNLMTIGKK